MPHSSTISALCSLTHEWFKELDNGNEICSIFFDLRKAFDSVPHTHLINTLSTLNLCPYVPSPMDPKLPVWPIASCCCWWWAIYCQESCVGCSSRFRFGGFVVYYLHQWYYSNPSFPVQLNLIICWRYCLVLQHQVTCWFCSITNRYYCNCHLGGWGKTFETSCRQVPPHVDLPQTHLRSYSSSSSLCQGRHSFAASRLCKAFRYSIKIWLVLVWTHH